MTTKESRYFEFLEHLPAATQDKSLVAIKGHLLLEIVLREYIYERVIYPDRLRNKNIAFSNLIDFASALEDHNNIQWIWQALRYANKIRNQLAHSLSPDKLDQLEVDFIEYVTKNDGFLQVETTEELKFEKLTLAYFQLYDVVLSSINKDNVQSINMPISNVISSEEETYRRVALALQAVERAKLRTNEAKVNKKAYYPQRSKKAKKSW